MTATDVNRQFLKLVNNHVASIAAARQKYSDEYVDRVLLPKHEANITGLVQWRETQMRRVSSFSTVVPAVVHTLSAIPASVSTAFRQTYNAKVSEINATANSAIAAARKLHTQSVQALNQQIAALRRQANQQIAASRRVRDTTSIQQVQAALKQANAAYTDAVRQAAVDMNGSIAAAKAQQVSDLRTLSDNLTAQFQQAAQFTLPVTSTSPAAGATSGLPSPALGTPQSAGATYYYDPASGTYIPTNQVTAPPSSVIQYAPPPVSAPTYYDPTVQVTTPDQSSMYPQPDYYDYSLLMPLPDFTDQSNDSISQPISPLPDPTVAPPLDVFAPDPWGGVYGAFAGPGALMGNRTIRAINRMAVTPARSIGFGFGQWGTLVSSVIQAGTQIGAAAATQAINPRQSSGSSGLSAAQLQAILAAQQKPASNNTPLIIGGIGIAALLVLIFAMKK